MTDTKLLPLPDRHIVGQPCYFGSQMQDYARANVAHVTAAKDAEIEWLRREVERLEEIVGGPAQTYDMLKARAERLAEALRLIANQGPHYGPDGTHKTWRHWADIARAALDQEVGNG